MANIVTENFNANATNTSPPAGWTASDFLVSDASPNFLIDASKAVILGSGKDDELPHAGYYGTDCTGSHSVVATWRGQFTNATRWFGAIARVTAATTYYTLRDRNGSAELWKRVAGTYTQIGSTITKASSTHDKNVTLTFSVSGSTLTGRIQRLDDSTYLASDGTWSVAAVDCFSTTDSSIASTTPAYAGWEMSSADRFNNVFDNVTIDSVAAGTPPAAPSGLSVSNFTITGCDVAWTDNASDEDGFTLQIDTVNTFDSANLQSIDIPTANTTGTSPINLEPNTLYYFRVLAYNGFGNSAWSSTVSGTTKAGLLRVKALSGGTQNLDGLN